MQMFAGDLVVDSFLKILNKNGCIILCFAGDSNNVLRKFGVMQGVLNIIGVWCNREEMLGNTYKKTL